MQAMSAVCSLAIFLLIQTNIYFFIKWRRAIKKPQPQPTIDAQAVLAELAQGSAVLKIEVLDPGDFLIRRRL